MSGPRLSIRVVIVNYCTARLTIECLASLVREVADVPEWRVTVVDNASPDGSGNVIAEAIAAHGWGSWVELIRTPRNGGFAYGNNAAIRPLLHGNGAPDLLWLLNPDTRVIPGALGVLHDFLQARPEVGIAASRLIRADGQPWNYAFRFPSILSELERGLRFGPVSRLLANVVVLRPMHGETASVDWVPGASMIVRRQVFDAIGLMDERYFLYFEETDFCLAARRAGWPCWYLPDAAVVHLAGQSTGLTDSRPSSGRVPGYWFQARRRYFLKNHGRVYAALADSAWVVAHLLWRVRRRVSRLPDIDPPALLADFLRKSAAGKRSRE